MVWNGEDLYRKHAEGVYRYLFALCREADTAEELTQETFYQALKGLNSFRGECAPQTWLCAIAKRLWYRELSRRGRTPPVEEALERVPAPDDPALETEEKDDRLLLYRAIQKLDPETREVIYLRLAGGLHLPGDRRHSEPHRGMGPDAVLPGQGKAGKADGREGT